MLLKIASRKSDLARLQAYIVAAELKKVSPGLEVEHLFSASFGDLNPDVPLDKMPTKGAFTEDFKEGIKKGEFDVVVHSWKDLPTDLPAHSQLYTLKREDPRDVLLVRKDSIGKEHLKVLTSSPRRIHHIVPFIRNYFPYDIKVVDCAEVRGNIPTRLKKLFEKEGDALVMAKAALDRLLGTNLEEFSAVKEELKSYLSRCQFMLLPLSEFPTAAAQGALAIEVNKDNQQVKELLSKIHCVDTYNNVSAERELLQSFGGGCHQKLGMTSLTHKHGRFFSVSGLTPNGEHIKRLELLSERAKKNDNDEEAMPPKNFFERRPLQVQIPKDRDLYISKDHALPESYTPCEQLMFCSGLSTWKKLAKRGHWVCGSSESLGEDWGKSLSFLLGREANWIKLSHKDAPGEKVATYELILKEKLPDLSGKNSFYWMSGSQFEVALGENPEIINARHACGPGNTHSKISQHIPEDRIEIYLSYEQWYENKLGSKHD